MINRIPLHTLIGQEKRAVKLFLTLLLSVIFITDVIIIFFGDKSSFTWLIPYIFLYLLIPISIVLIKKQKIEYIKYVYFLTYMFVCIIDEIVAFWGWGDHRGDNFATTYFVLFSPIFINKRYYWTVTIGFLMKYLLVGLIVKNSVVLLLLSMTYTVVFSMVAFIILNRFIGYINALNESYNKQFESTLSSGMAIMNHSVKNEIIKIQYLSSRLNELLLYRDTKDNTSILNSIQLSTDHMLNMTKRFNDMTEEIALQEGTYKLNKILDSAAVMIEPYKNNVRYIEEFGCDVDIVCDQLKLQEALINVLMNAVESMEKIGGILTIRLLKVKKGLIIEMEDTGCGISSDIRARVFEPFFTTRRALNNHGLGLSYSLDVMQKHGGDVEIQSEINVGTKVSLFFPANRIVRIEKLERGVS